MQSVLSSQKAIIDFVTLPNFRVPFLDRFCKEQTQNKKLYSIDNIYSKFCLCSFWLLVMACWALHCIKTGTLAAAANIFVASPRRGHMKETWHICMGRDTNWLVTIPMNWVMTDMSRDSWVLTHLIIPDINKSRLKRDLEPCCQFESKKVSFTGLFSSCLAPTNITRSFNNYASPRSHKTTCRNPAHKGDTGNNTANTPLNKGHVRRSETTTT